MSITHELFRELCPKEDPFSISHTTPVWGSKPHAKLPASKTLGRTDLPLNPRAGFIISQLVLTVRHAINLETNEISTADAYIHQTALISKLKLLVGSFLGPGFP